jgi:hypothetical protein
VTTKAAPSAPKTLRIGPYTYTVDSAVPDGLLGQTDPDALKIHLNPAQPRDNERETLLHEIMHAVFALTGMSRKLSSAKEESIIRTLSPLLLEVLLRNPKLRDYLFS